MQFLEIQRPTLIDSCFDLRIVGSCNGLICLKVINEDDAMSHRSKNNGVSPPYLLLWNPATREFRKIPTTIEDFKAGNFIGFGFTPIDNDYKIVIIRPYFAVNPVRVEVYSLNSGSWKEEEFENLEGTITIHSFTNVVLNGVLYRLGVKQGSSVHHDHDMVVSSTDLTKHVFTSIPLPDLGSEKSIKVKLTLYENKLAVVAITISSLVHLWVMEEDTCASRGRWIWTKKYTYSFSAMSFWETSSLMKFLPMTIWKNEFVFCPNSVLGDDDDEKLRFCFLNLTTSESKEFFIRCAPGIADGDFNYVESFVSVGNINNREP